MTPVRPITLLNGALQRLNRLAAEDTAPMKMFGPLSAELHGLLDELFPGRQFTLALVLFAVDELPTTWHVWPANDELKIAAHDVMERSTQAHQIEVDTAVSPYQMVCSLPVDVHGRTIGAIVAAQSQGSVDEASVAAALQFLAMQCANLVQNHADRAVFKVLKEATAELGGTAFRREYQVLRLVRKHAEAVMLTLNNAHVFCHVPILQGRELLFLPQVHDGATNQKLQAQTNYRIDLDNPVAGKIGIVGRAVEGRNTINVKNVHAEEYRSDYINLDPAIQSQLAVPILFNGKVIGVINIEHSQQDAFDTNAVYAIEALASAAAGAIQNVRLQNALSLIDREVAERRNAKLIFGRLLEMCLDLAICTTGSISMVDQEGAVLDVDWKNTQPHDLRPGEGVTAEVVRSQYFKYLDDVGKFPDYIADSMPDKPVTLSELIVPIVADNCVLGILNLQSTRVADFPLGIQQLVTAVANQAPVALRKFRLLTALDKLPQLSTTMGAATKEHSHQGSECLDVPLTNELYSFYSTEVSAAGGSTKQIYRIGAVTILTPVEQKGAFTLQSRSHERKTGRLTSDQLNLGSLDAIIKQTSDSGLCEDEEIAGLPGYFSHAGVRVNTNYGELRLFIHAQRRHAFDDTDIDVLRNVASLYGEAFSNVVRFNKLRRAVGAMNELNRKIAGYDFSSYSVPGREHYDIATEQGVYKVPKELWNLSLETACQRSDAEFGFLFATKAGAGDAEPPGLQILHQWALLPTFFLNSTDVSYIQAVGQQVLDRRRAVRFYENEPPAGSTICDCLGVAIRQSPSGLANCDAGDCEVLGVLIVGSTHAKTFDLYDDLIIRTLAEQATVALRYMDLREKLNRLIQLVHSVTSDTLAVASGTILEHALDLLGKDHRVLRGTLSIVNLAQNTLDLVAAINLTAIQQQAYANIPIDDLDRSSPTASVAQSGEPLHESDLRTAAVIPELPDSGSQIAVPIIGKNSRPEQNIQTAGKKKVVRAVLSVTSPRPNALTALDLEILTYYANLISLLWLYASQSKRTEILVRIATEWPDISKWEDLDLWKRITPAFHPICEPGSSDYAVCSQEIAGTLATLDQQEQVLELQHHSAGVTQDYVARNSRLPLANGVQGWVVSNARTNHTVIANIPDVEFQGATLKAGEGEFQQLSRIYIPGIEHERQNPENTNVNEANSAALRKQRTRSELAVPFFDTRPMAGHQVRGVINIESPFVLAFGDDDASFLAALGNYAYATLQHAKDREAELKVQQMAVAAHELNSYVSKLRTQLRAAVEAGQPPSLIKVTQWEKQATYLVERTNAVSEVAKFKPPSAGGNAIKHPVTCRQLFEKAKTWVTATKGHPNAEVIVEGPDLDRTLRAFAVFEWVPRLLLDNALNPNIRALPGEHQVRLSAHYKPELSCIELSVCDNGKGMTRAQRDTLNRGDIDNQPERSEDRHGLGWGLFLVARIVRDFHGGELRVEEQDPRSSNPGTCISVRLPN